MTWKVKNSHGQWVESPVDVSPLDADRMKQAIINVICGWQDENHCGRDADAIAAEYARLREPER